ncbi:MAG: response regulator transcription factor [Acidimicrobiaceae bacterium]|nr:response regulator transcription factor [Acidimicrobiaceae bacterium]
MIRSGFRLILEAQGDIDVVAEANDGLQAVDLAERLKPDVVLMDIRMPQMDGIEATRQINSAKVLILTTFDLDEYVVSALAAGASGFLLKDSTAAELVGAVRSIAKGDAALSPSVTKTILDLVRERPAFRYEPPAEVEDLSARELEVLKCLAQGWSNQEIGEHLYLSEATVKTYISRILFKLKLRDRVQAVVYAFRYGLYSE